jgi:hypothetical protein
MQRTQETYQDTLTKEETKAVDGFILLLKNKKIEYNSQKYNSSQLIKFLRARKLDINKSFEMFTNYLKWRQENDIDNISSFPFTELDRVKVYYPHGFHKTDKLGRPLYIDIMGELKIDELLKLTTQDRMVRYQIKAYERLMDHIFPACCEESKKYIHQTTTIIDLKKLSTKLLNKKAYALLKAVAQTSQNYYPESLGHLFIINTGLLFKAGWAVCKGFLDEKTRSKIIPLGKDYQKKLFDHVAPENVPKILGGTCLCEPYGCLYSDAGPWNKENKLEIKYNTELLTKIKQNEEELPTEEGNLGEEDLNSLENDLNDEIEVVDYEDSERQQLDSLSNQLYENLKVNKGRKENVQTKLERVNNNGATTLNSQEVSIRNNNFLIS